MRISSTPPYLVASIGCADCHASKVLGLDGPEPDMTRFLAGHAEASELPPPPQLPVGPWMAVPEPIAPPAATTDAGR